MNIVRAASTTVIVVLLALACLAQETQPSEAGISPITSSVPVGQNVSMFGLVELKVSCGETFDNPFWDPSFLATFTSPSGKKVEVEGFYYGGTEWRVRFVPREKGQWTFHAEFVSKAGNAKQAGTFLVQGQEGEGFLRLSKKNPYRMEYETGKPFYGIGLQSTGVVATAMDGPSAESRPSTASMRGDNFVRVSMKEWVEAFQGCVNLIRFQLGQGTKAGVAFALIPEGGPADRYDTQKATDLDEMYRLQRAGGMSQILTLFQDMSPYGNGPTAFGAPRDLRNYKNLKAENLTLQEKYIRYVMARYGCFVDVWEIFNEDLYAPDDYMEHLARFIREADPYKHILTTNFARYDKPWCELITPHEYVNVPANQVDVHILQVLAATKSYNKPVQYTEFGNKGTLSNYDPIKWRVASWTAFINESSMLYWDMSYVKTTSKPTQSGNSNAYIGPETRQAFRVLNEFTKDLPNDMRPVFTYPTTLPARIYALSNHKVSVAYVHHYEDCTKPIVEKTFWIQTGPGRYRIHWINPEDGKELMAPTNATTFSQYLTIPMPKMIMVDAAVRVDLIEEE